MSAITEGVIKYSQASTDAAINDASSAKGYCDTIINEIQALISNPIFGFKDGLSVLQENINKVSEINEILTEIKAQIESFCASLNIDVSLLDLELPILPSMQIDNKLNIPYFCQQDARWGGILYDWSFNAGAIKLKGSACGYTSLAMILNGLSENKHVNPYSVLMDLRNINIGERTYYGYGAAEDSELMNSDYLSQYNVSATEIEDKTNENFVSELKNGHPIIIRVPGHYMALTLTDEGKIYLLDPTTNWGSGYPKRGPKEYDSVNDIVSVYGEIRWAASYEIMDENTNIENSSNILENKETDIISI